jgi:hypothetical protein
MKIVSPGLSRHLLVDLGRFTADDDAELYLSSNNLGSLVYTAVRVAVQGRVREYVAEIPALLEAMRRGRIDGTTYNGECRCLVGTIAAARRVDPKEIGTRPWLLEERWFLQFRPGMTPGNSWAMRVTYQWIEDVLSEQGGRDGGA